MPAKPKKPIGRPGPGWFTRAEMAEIFGIRETNFDRDIRPLDPRAEKIEAKRLWFDAKVLIAAWAKKKYERVEDDEMMVGAPTEALEEYRRHRARQEKIKADELEKLCIYFDDIRPAFEQMAFRLKQTGEELKLRFGDGAVEIYNEGVDEALANAQKALSDGGITDGEPAAAGGPGGDGTDQPTPDHEAIRRG